MIETSNRFRQIIMILLKPKGYNNPWNWKMLWNQWLHKGFLWGWWSYEFYSKYEKDPIERKGE